MAYFLPIVGLMMMGAAGDEQIRERMQQSKAPWQYGCDNVSLFNKENRILCRGHVFAYRDDFKLRCDNFEAFRDAKGEVQNLTCSDSVQIESKDGSATAEKAQWFADQQTLVLTGKPIVIQQGNRITGEQIVYDLKNDRINVKRMRASSTKAPEMPKSATSSSEAVGKPPKK